MSDVRVILIVSLQCSFENVVVDIVAVAGLEAESVEVLPMPSSLPVLTTVTASSVIL